MAHLPLLFSESSHLLLTFFLFIWTSRWFFVHFFCCLNSCCSSGNKAVRTGWSEEHQGNVCLRLWLTLMDRVSSNTLTPFSHEAFPHFSSFERPSEFLTGAFLVWSQLYFYRNRFLIFFHFRFCTLGALLTHVSKRSSTYFIYVFLVRIWQPHSVWIIFQTAIVFSLGLDSLMMVLIKET